MKGKVLNSEDGVAKVVLPNEEIVKIDFTEMEQADDPDVIRRRYNFLFSRPSFDVRLCRSAYEAKEEKERAKKEQEAKKEEQRRKEKEKEKERKRERDRERDMNIDDDHSSKKSRSNDYDSRSSSSRYDSKSSRSNQLITIDDDPPSSRMISFFF